MTTKRQPRDLDKPDRRLRAWLQLLEDHPDEELEVLLRIHWENWAGWNWEGEGA